MIPPETIRDRLLRFRKQEHRGTLALILFSAVALIGAVVLAYLWQDRIGLGFSLGLGSTSVAGLWRGIRDRQWLRNKPELDPDLVDLNPALACKNEKLTQEEILPALRKRRQVELFLAVAGILTLLVAGVWLEDGFWVGVGTGLAGMASLLLVFTLLRLWRVDLFVAESNDL